MFTQENESRAGSQLRGGRVIGKIRVLAKSRNPCKLTLLRFHSSAKCGSVLQVKQYYHPQIQNEVRFKKSHLSPYYLFSGECSVVETTL